MAYPPPDHYLSDLGFHLTLGGEESHVAFEVEATLCAPGGGVLLGVLATAIDMAAGSLSARHAAPEWVATSDIAIDLVDPIEPGPARVDCRLGRRGRALVSLDLDLHGGHAAGSPRRGLATAAFAVLPNPGRDQGGRRGHDPGGRESGGAGGPESGGSAARENGGTRDVSSHPPSARAALPLHERLGIRTLEGAAGTVEAELADYVRNTFGALQGGVVAVLGEAAILAATGRPLSALAVRYRTLGRHGPFRAEAEVVSGGLGGVARAVVRDQGARGAVVAVAIGRSASR
ncbi:MAG TPA: hotdog domain-containing protein [Thermoanaerobaculia bacterium]|nr:hotdog domain-containing protein [Thermoanaerobaculia bacterium]